MWAGCLSGHQAWIEACSFSESVRRLASCSGDGTVRVWDVEERQCVATLSGHTAEVWSCHWHPKNANLLCSTSSDKSVIVWDVERERRLFTLEEHEDTVWCCRFSPDGLLLISTSSDKTAKLWSCDQLPICRPQLLTTLERRDDALEFAEFSPDCRFLCTVCRDGNIRLWKVERREKDLGIVEEHVDGCELPYRDEDKMLSRELSPVCESPRSVEGVLCEMSEDMLYVGLYCQLKRKRAWVRACAFSEFRFHRLATCSNDGRICVWDTKKRRLIRELCGHTNIVWSCAFLSVKDHGLLLVSCSSDQTLRFWNPDSGQSVQVIGGLSEHVSCQLFSCCFSPNGRMCALGGDDGKIHLLDVNACLCEPKQK